MARYDTPMLSITAFDRADRADVAIAVARVLGSLCPPLAGAGEAEFSHVLADSHACDSCGRSLGRKLNARLAHHLPPALGGRSAPGNIDVLCRSCIDNRADGHDDALLARVAVAMASEDPTNIARLQEHFDRRVFMTNVSQQGSKPAWLFLVYGEAAWQERLSHLRHTVSSSGAEIGVGDIRYFRSSAPFDGFHALITRSIFTAQSLLRECERGGDVVPLMRV